MIKETVKQMLENFAVVMSTEIEMDPPVYDKTHIVTKKEFIKKFLYEANRVNEYSIVTSFILAKSEMGILPDGRYMIALPTIEEVWDKGLATFFKYNGIVEDTKEFYCELWEICKNVVKSELEFHELIYHTILPFKYWAKERRTEATLEVIEKTFDSINM